MIVGPVGASLCRGWASIRVGSDAERGGVRGVRGGWCGDVAAGCFQRGWHARPDERAAIFRAAVESKGSPPSSRFGL